MPRTPPKNFHPSAYVTAAASLQNLNLDVERLAAVSRQFDLLTEMAERALAVDLPPDAEPAPVYRP